MNSANEYISYIGIIQGLLLFGLLVSDTRTTTASRLLGLICLVIALIFSVPIILANIDSPIIGWAIGPIFFLPVTLGPLGYFYCRSALLGVPLAGRDVLHLIPALLCYALTADISLADPREMAMWIAGERPRSIRLQIAEHLPAMIAYGYAAWTGFFLWRYRRQANDTLSNFNPDVFNWLLALQALNLVVWSLNVIPGPTSAPTLLPDVANIVLAAFIYVIAIIQWRRPLFFTIPALSSEPSGATLEDPDEGSSRRDGELDPSTRAELFETVRRRLEGDELYLDGDLTLERLAASTGLSKHHLSEVLNRHAGKNFYEFINGYRIAFVCERLSQTDQSVLDIAMEAGFSSKSTFNAIFRRHTGQTPTQFRTARSVPEA